MPPFIIDKIIEKTVAAPCILSSVSIANGSAVDCTSIYQGFQYGSMKSVNFTSDDHIITKGQWNYYGLLAAKLNLAGDTIWQKRLVKPSSMGFLQSFPTQDGIAICYSYNSGMHILRLSNAEILFPMPRVLLFPTQPLLLSESSPGMRS